MKEPLAAYFRTINCPFITMEWNNLRFCQKCRVNNHDELMQRPIRFWPPGEMVFSKFEGHTVLNSKLDPSCDLEVLFT